MNQKEREDRRELTAGWVTGSFYHHPFPFWREWVRTSQGEIRKARELGVKVARSLVRAVSIISDADHPVMTANCCRLAFKLITQLFRYSLTCTLERVWYVLHNKMNRV